MFNNTFHSSLTGLKGYVGSWGPSAPSYVQNNTMWHCSFAVYYNGVNGNVYIHGNRYFENTASTHGMKCVRASPLLCVRRYSHSRTHPPSPSPPPPLPPLPLVQTL